MTPLEELRIGAVIKGQVGRLTTTTNVTIVDRLVLQPDKIKIVVREPDGHTETAVLKREDEADIDLVTPASPQQEYTLKSYIDCGIISAPLPIEAAYEDANGLSHALKATILGDGCVSVNGKRCGGLTEAAKAAIEGIIRVQSDAIPVADGWNFWRFRDEDGALIYTRVFDDRYKAHLKGDL